MVWMLCGVVARGAEWKLRLEIRHRIRNLNGSGRIGCRISRQVPTGTQEAAYADLANPEADLRSLGFLAGSRVIAVAAIRQDQIIFANHAFEVLFKAEKQLAGISLHDLVNDHLGGNLAASLVTAERAPVIFLVPATDMMGALSPWNLFLRAWRSNPNRP